MLDNHTAEFRKALLAATKEMKQAIEERKKLDYRITQLKDTIETLSSLLNEKAPYVPFQAWEATAGVLNEYGITDAIRSILRRAASPLTPPEIKAGLGRMGFALDQYANKMAVIHNTLKRLERQDELVIVRDVHGRAMAYSAVAPDDAPVTGESLDNSEMGS